MPVMKDNEVLLYEVAEMYYEHGITQAEIGSGLASIMSSRGCSAAASRALSRSPWRDGAAGGGPRSGWSKSSS